MLKTPYCLKISNLQEAELEEKQRILVELETDLSDRELELATLRAELGVFENKYLQTVVMKYAILDDLKARIAAILAAEEPQDQDDQTAETAICGAVTAEISYIE